ncbi:MAG TPA: putative baseplate assembly protein [Longimicrobiaceae bacterium]
MSGEAEPTILLYEEEEGGTPRFNRPGQAEVRYRLGTHATFLERMRERMHSWRVPDGPNAGTVPLAALNPRPRSDMAVALLDAWATVGDVLTFYQERIANEGWLHTATEDRSVWELVSSLGYPLDPGAAAETWLAFWVTEGTRRSSLGALPAAAAIPSSVREVGTSAPPVVLAAGTAVQSIPRDGGLPQTFETSADVEARAEWNEPAVAVPLRAVPPRIDAATTQVRLDGIRAALKAGDPLVLAGDPAEAGGASPFLFRTVRKVETDRRRGYTVVTWDAVPAASDPRGALLNPRAYTYRRRYSLFGHDAPLWETQSLDTRRRYRSLLGGVFHSPDGGERWASVGGGIPAADPRAEAVRALAVGTDGTLYAAVAGKGVHRSRDGGASWQSASVGLRKEVHSLAVSARGYLFAGTAGGGVFRSRDGGTSWDDVGGGVLISQGGRFWKPMNTRLPTSVVRCVLAYANPRTRKHYLIAGTDDGLFGSTDTGNGWRPINKGLPGVSATTGTAPVAVHDVAINERNGDLWAATDVGVFRRTNRDRSWSPANAGLPGADARTGLAALAVRSVLAFNDPGSGRTAVVVASDAGIFRRDAAARRWQGSESGLPAGTAVRALAAGYAPDGTLSLFAATGGGLFRSADSGRSWARVGTPSAPDPDGVLFPGGINVDDVRLVAAGAHGEVVAAAPFDGFVREEWPGYHLQGATVDLDSSSARVLPGDRFVLAQPAGSGPVLAGVYAATAVEKVARRDWERTGTVTRVEADRPDGLDAFDLRAATAWVQEEELHLWEERVLDPSPLWGDRLFLDGLIAPFRPGQRVAVTGKRSRLGLADVGGVLRRTDDGWEAAGLRNREVRSLAVAPEGTRFAAAADGVYSAPAGTAEWAPAGAGVAADPRALAVTAGGRLAAAAAGGGVWLSGDAGRSWAAGGTLPETAAALAAEPDGELLAATPGGVFLSTGGAAEWTGLLEGLSCRDARTVLATPAGDRFAGTSGGGVFRMRAGEAAWTDVSDGLENRDVRALALAADGTVFAGTAGGVFRSAGGGPGWSPSSEGLHARDVRALLAAPDGAVYAGTRGGGVFRSDDGGRHWADTGTGAAMDVRALAAAGAEVLAGALDAALLVADDGLRMEELRLDRLFLMAVPPATLDGGSVTAGVRRAFRAGGINLGAQPTLTATTPGSAWQLQDGDDLYSLRAEWDAVAVYRPLDLLLSLTAPAAAGPAGGPVRLEARRDDGFTGTLHARPGELLWRAAAADAEPVSEVVAVSAAGPSGDGATTEVELAEPLRNVYDPLTSTVCGNVVHATHGTTVEETLGSGNASLAGQSFALRRSPLTYVRSADSDTGVRSTLVVRVNGVAWKEVPSLHDVDGLCACYQATLTQDGRTIVAFGDGERGARLPTGTENVVATYRVGIGPEGNVPAGGLRLLRNPAVGVRRVTNPVPAEGGAAPETHDQARVRAPLRTRTLARIVSFRDYEDYTRVYPGVGKAVAAEVWDGRGARVHLTVAPDDGSEADPDSPLLAELADSIRAYSIAPRQPAIAPPETLRFRVSAVLRYDPRRRASDVEAAARDALAAAFAWERRDLGQDVTASDVVSALQRVPGVVAVEPGALYLAGFLPTLERSLPARLARWDADAEEIRPAQILLLDADGVALQMKEAR